MLYSKTFFYNTVEHIKQNDKRKGRIMTNFTKTADCNNSAIFTTMSTDITITMNCIFTLCHSNMTYLLKI